jgi:hypothetical protein
MKQLPSFFKVLMVGTLWPLTPSVLAQEKVSRKTMIFQPGAKVPDGFQEPKGRADSAPPAPSATPSNPAPEAARDGNRESSKTEPAKTVKPAEKTVSKPVKGGSEDTLQIGESPEIPNQMAARFFGLLLKGQVDPAYDGLTKGSKIAERAEESKALRLKTQEALKVFGAVVGFEQVESKAVGPHLLRLTYLTVGKEFPLRWRLYFYRPDSFWRLVDIRVDDRLSGLFGEPEEARNAEGRP